MAPANTRSRPGHLLRADRRPAPVPSRPSIHPARREHPSSPLLGRHTTPDRGHGLGVRHHAAPPGGPGDRLAGVDRDRTCRLFRRPVRRRLQRRPAVPAAARPYRALSDLGKVRPERDAQPSPSA
ncbi:hypothetical protein ACFFX0_30950 [Citricoccus parietis]|uniref:Uncharacterized protein n=1 Tax=Citricoccus parietis TaxID=592307 RepID=A0ABV5G8K0_9MICC